MTYCRMSWIWSRLVAEVDQGGAERLVGDLEVSAAGELLEFHQGEVRLDAGGVAVHQQADGAGGGDDGGLGVAVAVAFAEGEGAVPAFAGGVRAASAEASGSASENCDGVDADRRECRAFRSRRALRAAALCGDIVRGAAMVADDAEHVGLILRRSRGTRPARGPSRRWWRSSRR